VKLSKCIKVVSDVPATVCQNLDRGDLQRQSEIAQEVLVSFGSAMQDILVHEDFTACEVDFLDTELGGCVEMWSQFVAGDLFQAVVGR
jgi:hypothetical protein